jgi:hypothetical protein
MSNVSDGPHPEPTPSSPRSRWAILEHFSLLNEFKEKSRTIAGIGGYPN